MSRNFNEELEDFKAFEIVIIFLKIQSPDLIYIYKNSKSEIFIMAPTSFNLDPEQQSKNLTALRNFHT